SFGASAGRSVQGTRIQGAQDQMHWHTGHALSAAARAKISKALNGKHHKGHTLSAATRAKIAAALKVRCLRLHAGKPVATPLERRTFGLSIGRPVLRVRTRWALRACLRRPREGGRAVTGVWSATGVRLAGVNGFHASATRPPPRQAATKLN